MAALDNSPERDPVRDSVNRIEARAIGLEGKLDQIIDTQDRHGSILDGNGKDGVLTRLALLEQKFEHANSAIRWDVISAYIALAASLFAFTMEIWRG